MRHNDCLDTLLRPGSSNGVTIPRSFGLRHHVAGALIVVLMLTGIGRGLTVESRAAAASFGIPGVAFRICQSGEADGSPPADQGHQHSCDACALCAPITSPPAPSVVEPAAIVRLIGHVQTTALIVNVKRFRTPRQSQGPPTA